MAKHKAFTVVELVIVIAVIGVLSAVLIPTFMNMAAKANEVSEDLKIRNLNNALALEEQSIDYKKNISPFDVIKQILKYGYKEDDLVSKEEDRILWNESNNRFIRSSKVNNDKVSYWTFLDEYDEDSLYSIYLTSKCTSSTIDNLQVGLDTGYNEIETINVIDNRDNNHRNIIRTNDNNGYITTLNVNGDNEIAHYGVLDTLNIISTSNDTYIEYGDVNNPVIINKGKLVLDKSSRVSEIDVENVTTMVTIDTSISTTIKVDDTSKDNTYIYSNSSQSEVFNINEEHVYGEAAIYNNVIRNELELSNAFTNGGSYVLMNNIDVEYQQRLESSITLSIDLHGNTLFYTNVDNKNYIVYNEGNLSIDDIKGTGCISSLRLFRNEGGSLRLNGGRFVSTENPNANANGYIVMNNFSALDGSLIIDGGTYITSGLMFASMHGSITINDGSFTTSYIGHEIILVDNNSTLTINNGTFNSRGIAIKSLSGTTTINDGTFNGTNSTIIDIEGGNTTINDGTFIGQSSIFSIFKGTLDINNCNATTNITIDDELKSLVNLRYDSNDSSSMDARINIYDGTYNSINADIAMFKIIDLSSSLTYSPSITSGIYIYGGNYSSTTLYTNVESYNSYYHQYL